MKTIRKQQLPKEIQVYWHLQTYSMVVQTPTALIFRATQSCGQNVVIKHSFQTRSDDQRSIDYLSWQNGNACIKLFDYLDHYFLLEDGGKTFHEQERINDALQMAAHIINKLHANTALFKGKLPTIHDLFCPILKALNNPTFLWDNDPLIATYHEAARLLRIGYEQNEIRPLHGDIHFHNMMFSSRGWVVIDPHGVLGHRAFDYANVLYNHCEASDVSSTLGLIHYACQLFSSVSGLSEKCILHYASLYGALSAFWFREDGNKEMELARLKILRLLLNEYYLLPN